MFNLKREQKPLLRTKTRDVSGLGARGVEGGPARTPPQFRVDRLGG